MKGNHYFDSVTDILNKVASEIVFLDFEIEVPEGSRENKENKWEPIIDQALDFVVDKNNRYLKP